MVKKTISFVFSRYNVNYLKEMELSGFKTYKVVELIWYVNISTKLRKYII